MSSHSTSESRARKRKRQGEDDEKQTTGAPPPACSRDETARQATTTPRSNIIDKLPPMPRFGRTNYKEFADSAVDYLNRPLPPRLPHLDVLRALGRGAIADEIEALQAHGEPIPSSDKSRKLISTSAILDKINRDYDEVDRLRDKADGLAAGKTYPEDVPVGARDSTQSTNPNTQALQGNAPLGSGSQAFVARNRFRQKGNRESTPRASSQSGPASATGATTTTVTGATEIAFDKVHHVIHINNDFSDGDPNVRPPKDHVVDSEGVRYRRDLAKYWMRDRGLAQPNTEYILDALPANYVVTRNPKNEKDRHIYIYGMPGAKRVQSAHKWYEHFEQMMLYSTTVGCSCEFCKK